MVCPSHVSKRRSMPLLACSFSFSPFMEPGVNIGNFMNFIVRCGVEIHLWIIILPQVKCVPRSWSLVNSRFLAGTACDGGVGLPSFIPTFALIGDRQVLISAACFFEEFQHLF